MPRHRPRRLPGLWSGVGLVVVLLLAGGCGDDGATSAVGSTSAAQLSSVMVGSDVVLAPDDVVAADVVGLDLVSLRVPLGQWWSSLNDPTVPLSEWVDQAAQLLAVMGSTVDHMAAQLGPGRAPAVRDTYTPYVTRWRTILATLADLRTAVASGDTRAQQRAVDDYNDHLVAIDHLDAQRVDRVVEAYGIEEATRALKAEGLSPQSLGVGS